VPAGIGIEVGDLVTKKQPLMSIQGRVIDYTTGKPPATVRVVLNAWFPFVSAGKFSDGILSVKYDGATGTFEAKDLIPGTYRVDAVLPEQRSSARPAGLPFGGVPTQSAFQILELRDADVQDLVLGVPASSRVAGRVIVSDGKPLPVAETNLPIPFQLMLRPLRGMQPAPVVTAVSTQDGTFEVGSGLEGQYRFSIGPLRDNYYVSETRLDGVRITNGILNISKNTISELILTLSPGGEIHGAVVDKQGRAVGQAQGILLPDPLPEIIPFYADIDANAAGQFTASGVPPGNYRIYVWEGIEPFQFFDRELLLRSGTVATRVRVERGSPTSASVQIIVP
jgi:hypothetical protein